MWTLPIAAKQKHLFPHQQQEWTAAQHNNLLPQSHSTTLHVHLMSEYVLKLGLIS